MERIKFICTVYHSSKLLNVRIAIGCLPKERGHDRGIDAGIELYVEIAGILTKG